MDMIQQFEISLMITLQNLFPWLTLPMHAITFFGDEEFYLLVMPALYWCIDSTWGLRMGAMLMLSSGFNGCFKLLLHSPRPYWINPGVHAALTESSFGLPSGHAMNAASVWGILASQVRQRWFTRLIVVIIFLIGFSRIQLGVHFISDVLLGWLLGGLLLLAFLHLEKPLIRWLLTIPVGAQLLLSLSSALVIIGLFLLPALRLENWELPAVWTQNALLAFPNHPIQPTHPSAAFTLAGTWLGMTTGAALFYHRRGLLSAAGSVLKRIGRYAFGMIGLVILWAGLGLVFPDGSDATAYLLRFIRYTLVGSWVSYFAPMLFVRLRLSDSNHKTEMT